MEEIKMKALINKKMNKVVCVECNADFVDVLFSFLTMPMGTILKLTNNQPSSTTIGSMNNLYKSVESLDLKYFRTKQCKEMLLIPKGSSDRRIKKIGLALGNGQAYDFFTCQKSECSQNLVSYKNASCHCGNIMDKKVRLCGLKSEDAEGGLFVKGLSRYIISDELHIAPVSSAAAFSLLYTQGLKNCGCIDIEEKCFSFGKDEILGLLKSLLVSDVPLTEILLKSIKVKSPDEECSCGINLKKTKTKLSSGDPVGKISVKLIFNQISGTVYYAEANADFIDLLFSFLTIPLGNVAKTMVDSSSKGCANNLYHSVWSLDTAAHLISEELEQSLLYPSIHCHFWFKKQLLGFEEGGPNVANYEKDGSNRKFTFLDPKSKDNKKETKSNSGGYVKGKTMFTVTENLAITPISALSGFSILKELNIPLIDIDERIVRVGKEEATRLLVASLISKSPLTDVFTGQVPQPEN